MMCRDCGVIFQSNRPYQVFCSKYCKENWHIEHRKPDTQEQAESRKLYLRDYYIHNKESILAGVKHQHSLHKDRNNRRSAKWRRQHPESDSLKTLLRRYQKFKITDPLIQLTPLEWEVIKNVWGYRCAYCKLSRPLTQDHVVPLSKGGEHTLSNIVPACKPCNSRKNNKDLDKFLLELAMEKYAETS